MFLVQLFLDILDDIGKFDHIYEGKYDRRN